MSETITALARGAIRLPGRAMVTVSDFAPIKRCTSPGVPDAGHSRIDVAVFPLGLVACQLDSTGVDELLEWLSTDTLPTSWSSTSHALPRPPFDHRWLELSRNRHIFVCTHGSRDQLCGIHGTRLLHDLRALIQARGLESHVAAWATSHVGGHKYAANAIVYPRGDWYGTWCEKCGGSPNGRAADAAAILDAAVHNITWWDAWRGATNMSKQDQISAWRENAKDHAATTGHTDATSPPPTSWVPATRRRSAADK
ncbi:hypothetical protein LPJ61_001341 [Coemansia biformis]|uniref:Sucraseferredoxin-like protein n=1 Tax=Coemansia biformis TaxID=1286918 RepID=A0A9W8D0R6_9FUNG|nr:hypothetical protein LPJ61_001341 [Coemansia biformis]